MLLAFSERETSVFLTQRSSLGYIVGRFQRQKAKSKFPNTLIKYFASLQKSMKRFAAF
jgi:hypothetical protein